MAQAATEEVRFDFDRDAAGFSPRQYEAIDALDSGLYKFVLYGGALGGGKSYLLRWYAPRYLIKLYQELGIKHAAVMLACEDYPSLKDRQLQKIEYEFPAWLGRNYADHRVYGRCFILHDHMGGGVIAFRNLDDPSKYASSEWALVEVDELTKNEFKIFDHLRTRLRWPGVPDMRCQFLAGTNPGSVGHGWVKQLWMDKVFPPEWHNLNAGGIDYTKLFAYIPSLADDNPHLDPAYWQMLETLPEALRKAFRYGDWNIFLGQAFPEFTREQHVIKPMPVPPHAPLYMGFDWGYGAPFSIGWYWTDMDGRLYRFGEWYGFTGQPGQGLRLSDTDIGHGIIEREQAMGIDADRLIMRYSNPDSFNKKPNYQGGGQGPSTAEVFGRMGINLLRGDPSRALKIRQFRERLRIVPGERPMLQVYDTCQQFLRTIPSLVLDEHNIEDVETKGEDHIYDETAVVCMARPMAMALPRKRALTMFENDMRHITGVDPRIAEAAVVPSGGARVWVDEQEQAYEADKVRRHR